MRLYSARGRQWIASKTGQDPALERFRLFGSKPAPPSAALSISQPLTALGGIGELPSKEEMERVSDGFFSSSSRFSFPFLDRTLFADTLSKVYDVSRPQLSTQACLWAAYAFMGMLKSVRNMRLALPIEECVNKAQGLLGLITSESSLENLQTLVILVRQISLHCQVKASAHMSNSKCIAGSLGSGKTLLPCTLWLVIWSLPSVAMSIEPGGHV